LETKKIIEKIMCYGRGKKYVELERCEMKVGMRFDKERVHMILKCATLIVSVRFNPMTYD
jgi:hypothetical protein